jgi:NADH-quinone oxidoreductase subunit E
MALSKHIKDKLDKLRPNFPTLQALVIPALHEVQHETGMVSEDSMRDIAEFLNLPFMKVREVVTFYTMFNKKPVGKVHYQLCGNIGCWLNGSDKLMDHMEKRLKIKHGQTTPDGKYTLSKVECLGACGSGPVLQVNEDYNENLDVEKLDQLMDDVFKKIDAGENNIGRETYNPEVWP